MILPFLDTLNRKIAYWDYFKIIFTFVKDVY